VSKPSSRIVVAVDGLAGSGKTTLARLLAERCGFAHLNSGQLYRAVALITLREKISGDDERALVAAIRAHRIELRAEGESGKARIYIDGRDESANVAHPEVSEMTSITSRHPAVRAELVAAQRGAFPGRSIVAEGRDMGTVIFPEAPAKFFITADQAVRVERRVQQLYGDRARLTPAELKSLNQKIQIEIIERDQRDEHRSVSPTKAAQDAIAIDNTRDPLTVVLQRMYDILSSRGLLSPK
jgi:cytidylate kinase